MWRTILAVVAGLVGWTAIVTVLNFGLRWWLPGYVAAEPTMDFTLAMQIARLSIGAVASIATGALVAAIVPARWWAPAIVGLIGLALFVPEHIQLWAKFPVWYHLTFLITLLPFIMLGGALVPRKRVTAVA